jgi:nucleotide-binding universal stress UspA family protein
MESRKICVAVALQRYIDFTPIALRLRELARIVAREYRGAIRVLSVDAPVPLLPDLETTEDKLQRYVAPLVEDGLDVHVAHRQGRPSREISVYVDQIAADLLIIGSHSKRGPFDVGLGSTAAAIDEKLKAAVILVRPTPAEQERTRELMIPRYPFIFPYG